ncbi:MAG: glycosyltransferase family 4 protein [Terracidiphilus sp.]
MSYPKYLPKILKGRRPSVHTMGKPHDPALMRMLGLDLRAEQELILQRGLSILASDHRIAFISNYVRNVWRQLAEEYKIPWPDSPRIRVIHHGLDLDVFTPSSETPAEPFVIGSAGAMRFTFRLATLFQVSRQLKFDHRLLLLGSMDDSCKRVMAEAMSDPQLAARITYVPWLDSEALPPLYRRMHCLFHPVAGESCGIVVTEAMACGVPVVVPAFGAPVEFVLPDGGIAVQTEPYKYDDEFCERMAAAVTRIRDNYDSFSKGSRRQAERYLSIVSCIDSYLDMLNLPLVNS